MATKNIEKILRDTGTPEPASMTDYDLGWLVSNHAADCACSWCAEERRRLEGRTSGQS